MDKFWWDVKITFIFLMIVGAALFAMYLLMVIIGIVAIRKPTMRGNYKAGGVLTPREW